jgi:predicted SnoaL-like aldol condensation-catalyzing enzyme
MTARAVVLSKEKDMLDVERNKQNVVAFYDLMFNQCRPREAIERYVGVEYFQHNPGVKDGKQGFIEYFEELLVSSLGSGPSSSRTRGR